MRIYYPGNPWQWSTDLVPIAMECMQDEDAKMKKCNGSHMSGISSQKTDPSILHGMANGGLL